MQKSERIVSYTAEELREKRARGESMTDWEYLDGLTEEELEASIDEEDEAGPFDPDNGVVRPARPRPESIGVDEDVHAWFKARGGDVEGIMNAVLRRWMVARLTGAESEPEANAESPEPLRRPERKGRAA